MLLLHWSLLYSTLQYKGHIIKAQTEKPKYKELWCQIQFVGCITLKIKKCVEFAFTCINVRRQKKAIFRVSIDTENVKKILIDKKHLQIYWKKQSIYKETGKKTQDSNQFNSTQVLFM